MFSRQGEKKEKAGAGRKILKLWWNYHNMSNAHIYVFFLDVCLYLN
jgi:hypothetical protein